MGSSPLARGLHSNSLAGINAKGIIPARAGFTPRIAFTVENLKDHPRSRGVYRPPSRMRECSVGSSPLARGLRSWCPPGVRLGRIIPARAGFTARSRVRSVTRSDHPRSRGVYSDTSAVVSLEVGSSPLARGLRADGGEELPVGGIIPARAGFTSTSPLSSGGTVDHPRSRGVYCRSGKWRATRAGSSPLARGLHLRILGIPTTSDPTRLRLPSLPT